jgi:L-amino acid N-acyltransferase YncA
MHFLTKTGQKVTLRPPSWTDLDELVRFTNAIVNEDEIFGPERKETKEGMAEWLARLLVDIVKKKTICLVAEMNDKIVGYSWIERKPARRSSHSGELVVFIEKEHRNIGIGTAIMKAVIERSMKSGIKIVTLGVAETNKLAYHAYTRLGFSECGRVSKEIFHKGKYVDLIWMSKEIQNLE